MATPFARGHQLTPKLGCACEYDTCTSPCRFFAKTWRFFFFMADIFSSAGFSCRAESFFTVAEKKVVGSSFTQVFLRLSAQYFVFWPESFCGAFACSICAPVRRGKSRQAPPAPAILMEEAASLEAAFGEAHRCSSALPGCARRALDLHTLARLGL